MNIVSYALSIKPTSTIVEVPKGWKEQLFLKYSRNQLAGELVNGAMGHGMYKIMDRIIDYRDRIYLVPRL